MSEPFFENPILNSPYQYPGRHGELGDKGQPTQKKISDRRKVDFITPIPKARHQKGQAEQTEMLLPEEDPLNLVVEIKGYRREDAKAKKKTMDSYWIPGVNHLGTYGRWAFAEFTDVWEMQSDCEQKVEGLFGEMMEQVFPHVEANT